VNNADVAIAAATAGCGITRVLSYMIAPQLASGELELVLDPFTPPAVPVHKEPGLTAARIRTVVDILIERLRKEPSLNYRG
jgi:DNA-binding transcriptional LysR family regulator